MIRKLALAVAALAMAHTATARLRLHAPRAALPRRGGNKCTYGPSYWCASEENAAECGIPIAECAGYMGAGRRVSSRLMGANKCTYGPSYWCASEENAAKCKFDFAECARYTQAAAPENLSDNACEDAVAGLYPVGVSAKEMTDVEFMSKYAHNDVRFKWFQEPQPTAANNLQELADTHAGWWQLFPDLTLTSTVYSTMEDGRVVVEGTFYGNSAVNGVAEVTYCSGVAQCSGDKVSNFNWYCDFTGILKGAGAIGSADEDPPATAAPETAATAVDPPAIPAIIVAVKSEDNYFDSEDLVFSDNGAM